MRVHYIAIEWNTVHVTQALLFMAIVNTIGRSGEVTRDGRSLILWCQEQCVDPKCAVALRE